MERSPLQCTSMSHRLSVHLYPPPLPPPQPRARTHKLKYHPHLGPWNAGLYSNAPPGLLETIASPTDSWETEDLLDLIRDAVALGAIHRKKDLPKIQAAISKGPEERRQWAKRLENKLDELMDKLDEVAPKKKRRAWLKE